MPLNGCCGGVLVMAVAAVLLMPAQYYLPGLEEVAPVPGPPPYSAYAWVEAAFSHLPPLDLFVTVSLIVIAFFTYICEWIQRKIMERRLTKLNQHLRASVESFRAWDAQQEQLDTTLKMVQNATCEYNLLLYLLLRQRRRAGHEKHLVEDLTFLQNPATIEPAA